jgi:DNA-binding transcriptional LysR family regulator
MNEIDPVWRGVELLIRSGTGVRATDAGLTLSTKARAVLVRHDQAARRARLRRPGNRPGESRLSPPGPSRSPSRISTRLAKAETVRDTQDGPGQRFGHFADLPRTRQPPAG